MCVCAIHPASPRKLALASRRACALCRSQAVLRFVHGTRQRLLRLRAITDRAVFPKHKAACKAAAWLGALTRHATALHQAPEHLYHAHATLATQLPVPLFDIAAARDIVATGAFELPGFVADLARDVASPPARRAQLLTECNALVLQLLHAAELPRGVELVQARAFDQGDSIQRPGFA
jgi:Mediator complex subunit MED14